jgi:transcriptional regulator with GAF, ATPase, and Fis domain/CHASE2 domain-containing sensor protein
MKFVAHIHHKILFIASVLLAAAALAFLQSRSDFLQNADENVLLRLRGRRIMPSEFLLVAIDESDVQALGGWPITRDYYGYLIHILTEKHAKVIGLDILLSAPNRQYPEYDRLLADFIESSGRVVLPSVADWTKPDDPSAQLNPLLEFARNAVGKGFSNLGDESTVRRVPLVMGAGNGLQVSFGLALAQAFLVGAKVRTDGRHVMLSVPEKPDIRVPVDGQGRMLMNPAGCISSIKSIRLTALLHAYETSPDSLDFSNLLVVVAAVAPSLPVIKSTPLCSQVPASLIHVAAAENILNKTWLRVPPFVFTFVWILAWLGLAYAISSAGRFLYWIIWITAGIYAAFGLSLAWLALLRVVMPLFLPVLLFLGSAIVFRRQRNSRHRRMDAFRMADIEARIAVKEKALADAERKLSEAETLSVKDAAEKIRLSETCHKLTGEKEALVLELEKQVRDLKASIEPEAGQGHPRFQDIIHGQGSPMTGILRLVEKVAKDDIPVLIQGETGTGKELIARAIHEASLRRRRPFVAVNCGALSESLLESELFGHEKGAFTGAQNRRKGRFELAQGGTLFLDEITETEPAFQARLLRVLQEGTYERVGGERTLRAAVRIIAAHNRDLKREVEKKRFREDLYFRLNGFPIDLPPLRNRRDDVPILAQYFVRKYDGDSKVRISDATMTKLKTYRWPGNVRELENALRRAVLLAKSEGRGMIQLKDLPEEIRSDAAGTESMLYHPLETQILETLRAFKFSHSAISQTAKALGNRDRGTVTEYFRGLCFQFLAEHAGDVKRAASALAVSGEAEAIRRVEAKMRDYVENVRASLAEKQDSGQSKPSCFKGLPQKFHPFLQQIIDTLE